MLRYDALANLTAIAAIGPWDRPYQAITIDSGRRWSACFHVGRGLPARATAEVRVQLQPRGDAAAQLFPGMAFELRDDGHAVAHGRITHCWFGCAEGFGVRTLTRAPFLTEALPLLRQVFRVSDEPFEGNLEGAIAAPFEAGIAERGVLATALWCFPSDQCQALVNAAAAIGDTGLYHWVHEAGISEESLDIDLVCYFPLGTAAEREEFLLFYDVNEPLIGSTLFSATGRWGAIAYGGADHAVLGGPTGFVTTVYDALGTNAEEQALKFLAGYESSYWVRDHSRCPWVPELLTHLYGEAAARHFVAIAEGREPPR